MIKIVNLFYRNWYKISSKKKIVVHKELDKSNESRGEKKKKLTDFYGKMPGIYNNGLTYQKKVRNEW